MARAGVVAKRRRMGGDYNLHVLTLAQVPNLLRVEGSWPGAIALRAGWFRARARPWNDSVPDPMVRLDRGGTEFLIAVTRELFDLGAKVIYSPALYEGSSAVWRRSGFEEHAGLDIMERGLSGDIPSVDRDLVRAESDPDWDAVIDVDQVAFEGFWGMSRLGLAEAYQTNRSTSLLVSGPPGHLSGYAIVGSQWGTVYLHRIGVRPDESGRGLGGALLRASIAWGSQTSSRSMVLNVRPENQRAKRLYERHGFVDTGSTLRVLRRRQ